MNSKITSLLAIVSQNIGALDLHSNDAFLIENLTERIELIIHKLKFFPDKPKVVCIKGLSPIKGADNLVAKLVEIAGGKPILIQNEEQSPSEIWDLIAAENPEIIVAMPCGFTIARTLQQMDVLLGLPGWKDATAVKNNRVYIADASSYFNTKSPHLVDWLEILAEIINPQYLNFGYEGTGWIKFEC
ncbi:MAG: hypothetical protein EAZ51_09740 [Sphingobacteriales bacterium]|nr:MAG: hypothetical protein EAZ64_01155 [Sphingobacteriales bacterium]TAF78309.1 MAG: hypothetical protein EAZ51_09740 [Sphingobacteriales bacterium]